MMGLPLREWVTRGVMGLPLHGVGGSGSWTVLGRVSRLCVNCFTSTTIPAQYPISSLKRVVHVKLILQVSGRGDCSSCATDVWHMCTSFATDVWHKLLLSVKAAN